MKKSVSFNPNMKDVDTDKRQKKKMPRVKRWTKFKEATSNVKTQAMPVLSGGDSENENIEDEFDEMQNMDFSDPEPDGELEHPRWFQEHCKLVNLLENDDMSNEIHAVNSGPYTRHIKATIDSGAAESVAPPEAAPEIEVKESEGSLKGKHYVTAGKQRIPNIGEQRIPFTTKEGHKTALKWQNAEVSKPLLSVSRICDAGHDILFNKNGGHIKNLVTGRTISFERENGVYVLDMKFEVSGDGKASGFIRPGQ